MKSKNLIIGFLCFFILIVLFSITTKSQKPEENPKFEVIEIGTGGDPHWSPDGTQLAFIYKDTICLANADGTGEIKKLFEMPKTAYRYYWLDSTEFLFQERELVRENEKGRLLYTIDRITAITLNGQKKLIVKVIREPNRSAPFHISAPIFLPDGTVGYYEVPPGKRIWETENMVFKVIKQGKLYPDSAMKQMIAFEHDLSVPLHIDRSIWLESVDGSIKKKISSCDHCSFPKLSPDGTKIVVMCGGKCAACVLDLDGNEICVGKEDVRSIDSLDSARIEWGVYGVPTWSPDSKKLAYSYVKSKSPSEHDVYVVGSDLYMENPDGTGRVQLTDTPDRAEGTPVWSPDGTKIACDDFLNSKVYVIRLK
jgi:Tol biopolymer transport system component